MLCWPVWAVNANCTTLFQQKKYDKAAACFRKEAQRLGAGATLSQIQRWSKGRLLRNAATCYKQAAHRATPAQAAFWREQAMLLWKKYQAEKLYENQSRRQEADRQIQSLRREIGYATLTMKVVGDAANICLHGYRFKRCQKGKQWRVEVRPGSLRILGQRGKQRTQIKLTLAPGSKVSRILQIGPVIGRKRPVPKRPVLVSLRIQSNPSGATVFLAGRRVGKTPLSHKLSKSLHSIRVSLPCYRDQMISLKNGASRTLSVTLKPSSKYTQWLASQKSSGAHRIWGWVVLSSGVAAVVLGTVGQIVASNEHAKAENQKLVYTNAKDVKVMNAAAALYEQTASNGNTWRTVGYIGLGVGVAGIGVGLTRLLTLSPGSKKPCTP